MSFVTWGLSFTMLGMGLTMKVSDFTAVFTRMPALLGLGLSLQFTVMPILGFLLSRLRACSLMISNFHLTSHLKT